MDIQVGDYVLATKYHDGDTCDHFVVGFVSGMTWHERFDVVDKDGKLFRHNGFRRAQKITAEEGQYIIDLIPTIGDNPSCESVWWFLEQFRMSNETAQSLH